MSPLLAASLSLVPGLGHLVIGKRKKAVALFLVDIGLVCSVFFLKSIAGHILTCFGYFMVMIPTVIETYTFARGGVSQFSESKPYILGLLLMTGFSALPLLWQSRSFSKRNKIVLSAVVSVLAILYFSFLGFFGIRFMNYADSWFN